MAPILTIFGPNRSRRRDLFFEKFSNERRRHRGIVVVIIVPRESSLPKIGGENVWRGMYWFGGGRNGTSTFIIFKFGHEHCFGGESG